MARAKRVTKNKVVTEAIEEKIPLQKETKWLSRKNIILAVLFILAVFGWKFKSYFIVATVNGQPISRAELNSQLSRRFGDQTLDNIINERLILAAIRQKGIFITKDEIDVRVKQVEERLNGSASLTDALKAQGLIQEEFRRQIEIQLSISKLFDKEATVATSEVEDYINKNKQAYKDATDPAALQVEIKDMIRQQKIGDLFTEWFNDIRNKASIKKFL